MKKCVCILLEDRDFWLNCYYISEIIYKLQGHITKN